MTKAQLALMRTLAVAGALVLIGGIVLLVIDQANPQQVCTYSILGYEQCRSHTTARGAWIAGAAVLVLIGTAVAWSTLTPADAEPRPASRRLGWRWLAVIIGGLFVLAMVGAAIDIFAG